MSAAFKVGTTRIKKTKIPRNIQEALEIPKWRNVVEEDVRAFKVNGTWELIKLPKRKHVVGCK